MSEPQSDKLRKIRFKRTHYISSADGSKTLTNLDWHDAQFEAYAIKLDDGWGIKLHANGKEIPMLEFPPKDIKGVRQQLARALNKHIGSNHYDYR